jgi:ribose transport system permease protein
MTQSVGQKPVVVAEPTAQAALKAPPDAPPERQRRFRVAGRDLALDRYSGLYVAIVLAVFFSIWNPTRFGTVNNARIIASSEAITGILTLGLIISLLAGMFDVSIAANMSLAISLVGWLQSTLHLNPALAVVLTLMCGALIGLTNAFVITKLRVEPVIATLGMSSVLAALAYWIAKGNTILDGISPGFKRFGSAKLLTIPVPVFYLLGVGAILLYLLEHTPTGRYMYASGANAQAARLAGLKVVRLQWTALIISGTLASFAGIVLTMQLGAASFGAGGSYLLPAFAAAFLGSTQVRPGRFNVLGTLLALYLLAIGVKGLQLQYPQLPWIKDFFEGVTLIFAVALGARAALRRASR